jgi:hypothetical protein
MEDLQKRLGEQAGLPAAIYAHPGVKQLVRLAMQHAAEEAAKVCENGRLWELLAGGRPMERVGPLDCAHAIRERFKAL